jgi:hypothetical protein
MGWVAISRAIFVTVVGGAAYRRAVARIPAPSIKRLRDRGETIFGGGLRPDVFDVRRRPATMRPRIMALSPAPA